MLSPTDRPRCLTVAERLPAAPPDRNGAPRKNAAATGQNGRADIPGAAGPIADALGRSLSGGPPGAGAISPTCPPHHLKFSSALPAER